MEKLSAHFSQIRPTTPEVISRGPGLRNPSGGEPAGTAFRDQLSALNQNPSLPPQAPVAGRAEVSSLRFSNHAVDRMRSRGLSFTPEDLSRMENAVAKAASKGSKDTLLITDKAALIVSVKDSTVVTVMDKASLKENVFTNIDSTVML